MSKFSNVFGYGCTLIPFCCLMLFATLLGLNVANEAQTVAKVTQTKDQFSGEERVIYYEYEFMFNDLNYIGADVKSFAKKDLGEARSFVNQTSIAVYFCKNDPRTNGLERGVCLNIFWVVGVAMSTFFSLFILMFLMQNLRQEHANGVVRLKTNVTPV